MRLRLLIHLLVASAALVLTACAGPSEQTTQDPNQDDAVLKATVVPGSNAAPSPSNDQVATTAPVPVETPTATPTPIEILKSIPYAESHPRQTLDLYLPDPSGEPFATILAIHGGAFRARSKDIYAQIGSYFAERGYAFVAINYRLVQTESYPAQVEDAFCALAWLHANHAEHGFDPSRVVVWGGSAGGYLAAMLGTVKDPALYLDDCPHDYPTEDAVRAVAVFYGFYDFVEIDDYPAGEVSNLTSFWGAQHDEIPTEQLVEMSPIKQIEGDEPPFILIHGTADSSIPSVMSERFAEALREAGVEVELVLLDGVGHAFELKPLTGEEMSLSLMEIETFLDRVLPRN